MWDLSQNDGPTTNVLIHIIIYFTVYKKHICILIGNLGKGVTYYFGIRTQVA